METTKTSENHPDPATGGRVARRRAQVRQRILDAAERLIAKHGIDNVTVDTITEAADIARRSFYHHFTCKHEVMIPVARERTKSLNRRIDRRIKDIDDPAEVMATGIRYGLREMSRDQLCQWFVLHSGLPQERLADGMGASGARDAASAIKAGRFNVANDRVINLLVSGAFLAALSARVEERLAEEDLDDAVEYLLRMFGLNTDEACDIAHRPLRPLPRDPATRRAAARNQRKTTK
jgi:AcrR family transcriptional regulator